MTNIIASLRGSRPLGALLLVGVGVTFTGCDDLLTVEDVDVTTAESFVDLSSVPALRASVRADYVDIYEDLILYGGLLADEWVSSGTFPTRIEVDARDIRTDNATVESLFADISRARAIADFADQRFDLVDPDGEATDERAEVRALGGLALVHMAETYCEGTPMSRFIFDESAFEYGGPLTRAQVLDSARVRLNGALDLAAAGSDQDYLARIGLARVLQNEGDYAGAAAQVSGIPTSWIEVADHDAQSGQNNPIWNFNHSVERWSVSNLEGGNGLPYRDAMDPRVLWERTPANDVGFDSGTPQYDALKYSNRPAYTPIASGVEARLIEAEAALDAGDAAGMLDILNDLRSQVETIIPDHNFDYVTQLGITGFEATLPQLTLPGTYEEQVDLLFQERAYWLWLTARRHSDMRRLIRQYGRDSESVFPTGGYAPNGNTSKGVKSVYGPDVNFPIPVPEENNPEQGAGQCLNRNA